MGRKVMWLYLSVGILCFLSGDITYAESTLNIDSIKMSSRFIVMDGDEGRFREDNFITDNYSGGLEELLMSGNIKDALLYIDAHAIYDGDYGLSFDLSKEDSYYFKLNTRQTRRYYDGSNEPWNPTLYNLNTDLADFKDTHLYVDRYNTDVEWGLKLDHFPDLTLGYTRWIRDGRESLLRGEDAQRSGLSTLRSIPMLRSVDGASDKVFIQLSDQIAEKHNVAIKQELEIYHDDQVIDSARYNTSAGNAAISQQRTYLDEPQFRESLTHMNYNSFLTEKTYLSSNYIFQDLKNRTGRTEIRPISNFVAATGNTLNQFINPDTDNQRRANILNLGLVNLDSLIKDLRIGLNTRFESSETDNEGEGLRSGTTRKAESDQSEYQYAQSLSLSYSGITRTSITYTLETEQRKLNWSELADITSYELVSNFGATATTIDRETNIRHNDIINTLQVSTRLNNKSKVTAKYKHSDKKRKYENVRDNLPTFYPGYLGSSEQDIDQVTTGYHTSITDQWSGGLQYVFEANELGYAVQTEDGMQLTRNAISSSATGLLTDKFTLTPMIMAEFQDMETPAVGISANPTFAQGEDPYDYTVQRYIALLGGNYRLSDKTSTGFGFQHTEVAGTLENSLDKLWVSANHEYSEDKSLEGRLEIFNFNEKTPGGYNDFDDYHGVGAEVVYSQKF